MYAGVSEYFVFVEDAIAADPEDSKAPGFEHHCTTDGVAVPDCIGPDQSLVPRI